MEPQTFMRRVITFLGYTKKDSVNYFSLKVPKALSMYVLVLKWINWIGISQKVPDTA